MAWWVISSNSICSSFGGAPLEVLHKIDGVELLFVEWSGAGGILFLEWS